jgi:hypothetical protein
VYLQSQKTAHLGEVGPCHALSLCSEVQAQAQTASTWRSLPLTSSVAIDFRIRPLAPPHPSNSSPNSKTFALHCPHVTVTPRGMLPTTGKCYRASRTQRIGHLLYKERVTTAAASRTLLWSLPAAGYPTARHYGLHFQQYFMTVSCSRW